jgi:hypothetical protein
MSESIRALSALSLKFNILMAVPGTVLLWIGVLDQGGKIKTVEMAIAWDAVCYAGTGHVRSKAIRTKELVIRRTPSATCKEFLT